MNGEWSSGIGPGRRAQAHRRRRCGGARVELIVAAACIAVLAAVAIPLINSARTASRQQTCLNHVGELARAVEAHAQIDASRLPPLHDGRVGWPGLLLVQLRLPDAAAHIGMGDVDDAARVPVGVFTCPFDEDSFNRPGGLSYVGNSGYGLFDADPRTGTITGRGIHSPAIDLDGDGEASPEEFSINFATGVFWPETDGGRRMTLDFISDHDGRAQTMLVTENLHAGAWTSRETLDVAFVIGRDTLRLGDNPVGPRALALPDTIDLGLFAPHTDPGRPVGRSPVPSSLHAERIHVGYCDGSARPTSVHIDARVYARLMTPAGTRYGQGDE
ncbi:MAG TPA: hypothetical protein VML55_21350 [Planctomycetaceae bacterium]|nr:hypothetical protein [Planctomycetaceae bacterium]